jgi:membrane-associated phospholipid phosphatase
MLFSWSILKVPISQGFMNVLFFKEAFTFAPMQGSKNQLAAIIPLLIATAGLAISLFLLNKADAFHFWNQLLPLPISAWQVITFVGDGLFAGILVVLIALFQNRSLAAAVLLSWLLGAALAQGLKHTVFKDEPRPKLWFEQNDIPLEIPTDLHPHAHNSMPSGHTTTAFGVFGLLAWLSVAKTRKAVLATLACMAGVSRIALFQHFPADVLAGALLGMCTIPASLYLYHVLQKRFPIQANLPFIQK